MSCCPQDIYKVITPNLELPLSLDEVKLYCRIDSDNTAEDDVFNMLICTAMKVFEQMTGRTLMKTGFETYRTCWKKCITLKRSPLVSIDLVKYIDTEESEQTVNSDDYYIAEDPFFSSLIFDDTFDYPNLNNKINQIIIQFTAGYAQDETEVPCDIKNALLQYVCFLYQNRGDCACMSMANMPATVKVLFSNYKIHEM